MEHRAHYLLALSAALAVAVAVAAALVSAQPPRIHDQSPARAVAEDVRAPASRLCPRQLPLAYRLSGADVRNLRRGQRRMTEMLRVFDELCETNGITYFAIGGTLLGAEVYAGWIPWDGDVDVEILQSDWPRLENLLKTRLPDSMWLQTQATDKHYRSSNPKYIMGKIRDLDSCYRHCQDGTRYHNGFMIDLNLFYIGDYGRVVIPDNPRINYMLSEDLFPLQRKPFESIYVNVPRNTQKYLRANYGANFRSNLPRRQRYPHEGILDPDNACPHHHTLYPHVYDAKGRRRELRA